MKKSKKGKKLVLEIKKVKHILTKEEAAALASQLLVALDRW